MWHVATSCMLIFVPFTLNLYCYWCVYWLIFIFLPLCMQNIQSFIKIHPAVFKKSTFLLLKFYFCTSVYIHMKLIFICLLYFQDTPASQKWWSSARLSTTIIFSTTQYKIVIIHLHYEQMQMRHILLSQLKLNLHIS